MDAGAAGAAGGGDQAVAAVAEIDGAEDLGREGPVGQECWEGGGARCPPLSGQNAPIPAMSDMSRQVSDDKGVYAATAKAEP